MTETRNLRACFGYKGKEFDRVSELPDELIHRIMFFMNTIHAIQTSILSKRWINIWKSLPFLNFYMFDNSLDKLIDQIDRVFMLRDDCDIQSFCLTWRWFSQSPTTVITSVSRWIDTAVRRNVQEVTLELLQAHPYFTYEIPPKLLNCKSLKKLTLWSCIGYLDILLPKSMSLPKLKFMGLGGITLFHEELSTRLFSSCPLLEKLQITNCDIHTDTQKNFTVYSLSLKKFEYYHRHWNIINYLGHHIRPKVIMLSAPNLTSFTCNYEEVTLSAPNLTSFTCHNEQLSTEEKEVNAICMVKLLVAVNKVEQLVLSPGFLEVLTRATNLLNCQLRCLCNLQCLTLETWVTGGSLRTIAYLFTISPNIKNLILQLNGPNLVDDGHDLGVGFSLQGMLSHLNMVRIEEMVGCDAELKLLGFLFKNAKVLKKVGLFFRSSDNFLDTVRRVDKFKDKLRTLPRASSNIKNDVDLTFADNKLKILM